MPCSFAIVAETDSHRRRARGAARPRHGLEMEAEIVAEAAPRPAAVRGARLRRARRGRRTRRHGAALGRRDRRRPSCTAARAARGRPVAEGRRHRQGLDVARNFGSRRGSATGRSCWSATRLITGVSAFRRRRPARFPCPAPTSATVSWRWSSCPARSTALPARCKPDRPQGEAGPHRRGRLKSLRYDGLRALSRSAG